MKETTLLKISLITAITGLLILVIITAYIEPDFSDKKTIYPNDFIKLRGIVTKSTPAKNSLILEITESKQAKAIIFDSKNISITEGTEIEIIGKKEDNQIVVDKIRVIS